ncbi:hypothetical protein [Pseudomonas syringae]|nr:hypothetical protein [Pseudomonas syringae]
MGRKGQWWNTKAKALSGRKHVEKAGVKHKASNKNKLIGNVDFSESIASRVQSVYRYFDDEKFADAFVQGAIYISTLEKCRQYEDPLQGDPHEGHDFYSTGSTITGDGDDPEFVSMAARLGIYIAPHVKQTSLNVKLATAVLRHAYVLCTTIGFESDDLENTFGNYCVKIEDVEGFFNAVTRCLCVQLGSLRAGHRSIIYKERFTTGMQPMPGPIGFVKPPDKYASQCEYRFLWFKDPEEDAQPLVIHCPEAAKYVTRVK